jgi:hypothetical protein
MRLALRERSLPLGADIGPEFVSLVHVERGRSSLAVRDCVTRPVPAAGDAELDLAIAETLRAAVATLVSRERRCVLAAPAGEIVHRTFRLPPGMRRHEAERAAALEADTLAPWPAPERVVALDPIDGRTGEMLLSIARSSAVLRLTSIASAGGLRPVAVDLPACAWRRAVPETDAVLEYARERAQLVIFGDPVGTTHAFPPRSSDERLATLVRSALIEARREGIADVRRLSLLGPPARVDSLAACLHADGYAVAPVTCGTDAPAPWAFAYGLALWSAPAGAGAA